MVDGGKLSAARDRPKTFRGIRRGISAGDGEKQKEKKKKKKRKKKETKGEKRTICQNASRLLPFTNRFTHTHTLSLSLPLSLLRRTRIMGDDSRQGNRGPARCKFVRSGIKFLSDRGNQE